MKEAKYPPPALAPLDRVTVLHRTLPEPCDSGILGFPGVVLWRTSFYVRPTPPQPFGWLYVVRSCGGDHYQRVEESRLVATGESVSLQSQLGRAFEISYDSKPKPSVTEMAGVFRTPGSFWSTFVFRRAAVRQVAQEIHMPVPFGSRGLVRYQFLVPEDRELSQGVVEEILGEVFQTPNWTRIVGPCSAWFC